MTLHFFEGFKVLAPFRLSDLISRISCEMLARWSVLLRSACIAETSADPAFGWERHQGQNGGAATPLLRQSIARLTWYFDYLRLLESDIGKFERHLVLLFPACVCFYFLNIISASCIVLRFTDSQLHAPKCVSAEPKKTCKPILQDDHAA